MHIDEIEKLKVYKDRIIAQYIKQGIYPSDDMVKNRLGDIDLALAVFSHDHIKKGSSFDVDAYNNAVKAICADLTILYKNLYEISVKRFTDLQSFAYSHIKDLDSDISKYEKMVNIELMSSLLGDTLLCATGNFDIEHFNTINIVRLGQVSATEGTDIACLADINNVDGTNVYFELREAEMDYSSLATPKGFYKRSSVYNYNSDYISVPFSSSHDDILYDACTIESPTSTGKVIIPIRALTPTSEYNVFSGSGLVNVFSYDTASSSNLMVDKAALPNSTFAANTTVEFYVLNGDSITFEFSKQPESCNFTLDSNNQVTGLSGVSYFRIVPAEGSTLGITINKGEIYATESAGEIVDGKLYATIRYGLSDFRVLERTQGSKKSLYAYLIVISNDDDLEESIESIAIKCTGKSKLNSISTPSPASGTSYGPTMIPTIVDECIVDDAIVDYKIIT